MENDSISSSSSESKLPLIVGILGFALGAAGLVLGIKAKSAAQAAGDEAAKASQSVEALGATVASKATAAELATVSADLSATKAGVEANFKSISDSITALATKKSAPTKTDGKGAGSSPAGPGEHIVAKGETLGGIAKQAGLSLKAIQDLNPGVDSTKLRIGSKIKTK